jgi:hypothetical protein
VQKQNTVVVYFTNETEEDVDHYTLERSGDGQTFAPIGQIKPVNNNGSSATYITPDANPLEKINLYRVKAKERNGKVTFSPVIRVNLKDRAPGIVIVPNPARKGDVVLQLSNVPRDRYIMTLYNAQGQVVKEGLLQHAGGSSAYPLKVDHLLPGTYILELSAKEKLLQPFVIL